MVEDVDFDIVDCARAWHIDDVLKDFRIMPDLRKHGVRARDVGDIFGIPDRRLSVDMKLYNLSEIARLFAFDGQKKKMFVFLECYRLAFSCIDRETTIKINHEKLYNKVK